MTFHIKKYFLLLLAILVFAGAKSPQAPESDLVAIVNIQDSPDELSAAEFKKVMLGEKQRWGSGNKVSIALMKTTHPTGRKTASQIYDMTGDELNKYWLSLVFQGKAKAPSFFNSEKDLIEYISVTPGAVGIVQATNSTLVKKLKVQGTEFL